MDAVLVMDTELYQRNRVSFGSVDNSLILTVLQLPVFHIMTTI
jgi:hypothetical protein